MSSIAPVGSYTPRFSAPAYTGNAPQPAVPAQPSARPQYRTGGTSYQPVGGSSLSLGRMASWAAGGFAAWRWVLPMFGRGLPGLVQIGVVGAGALGGNWLYNKFAGAGGYNTSTGGVGRYLAWGGGALAAYKLGMGMMGSGRPSGLVIGGLLAGGALAGNWLYNKLTGR